MDKSGAEDKPKHGRREKRNFQWESKFEYFDQTGYAGKLVTWVATVLQRTLVIVKRHRHTQGFQVVQWRWIVERTFGWLHRSRRLSNDFEALLETTEAWIRIAMIHLMVRRLAARA
jgi:hypothetical protein